MEWFKKSQKNKTEDNAESSEKSQTGFAEVTKRGMAEIDLRQFISAFVVLIVACIIPYLVRIVDIVILVIKGIGSLETRGSYEFEEILTQDFNQPMNLAYVMLFNYLLYIIVFGLWYGKWNGTRDCVIYTVKHRKNKEVAVHEKRSDEVDENSQVKADNEDAYVEIPASQLKILGWKLLSLFKTPVPYLLILAGVSGQVLVDGILNFFRNLFPAAFEEYDAMVSSTVGATSSVVMLIAVFILAPIGEEFLFRGLIQGKLARAVNYSPMPAVILLQGLLFGVYHGNLIQGIYAFLLGALLGLIAYRAGSLLPCIIFHMTLNTSVCLVSESWFEETGGCLIAVLVSIAFFVPSVVFALKLIEKSKAGH